MFFANSSIIVFQFFALTIPLATKIPLEPSEIAAETSSPETIPAPQRSLVLFFAPETALAAFTIRSGCSFDTALPDPINSGGSIAM